MLVVVRMVVSLSNQVVSLSSQVHGLIATAFLKDVVVYISVRSLPVAGRTAPPVR